MNGCFTTWLLPKVSDYWVLTIVAGGRGARPQEGLTTRPVGGGDFGELSRAGYSRPRGAGRRQNPLCRNRLIQVLPRFVPGFWNSLFLV